MLWYPLSLFMDSQVSYILDSNSRVLGIAFPVFISLRPISETLEFCMSHQLDPLYLQSHLWTFYFPLAITKTQLKKPKHQTSSPPPQTKTKPHGSTLIIMHLCSLFKWWMLSFPNPSYHGAWNFQAILSFSSIKERPRLNSLLSDFTIIIPPNVMFYDFPDC